MAKTSVSKPEAAARMAETVAAQKSGAAWAQLFINRYLNSPDNYELQGWIDDANELFKDDPDELSVFYETLQRGYLKSKNSAGFMRSSQIEEALHELRHIKAQCDLMFTYVSTGGSPSGLLKDTLSSYLDLMLETCDRLSEKLQPVIEKAYRGKSEATS